MKATVKYAVLPSCIIFNECGPNSADRKSKRNLVEASLNENGLRYVNNMNSENGFYSKLEDHILKNGIRNPIIVHAGWCPDSKIKHLPEIMQTDSRKILICYSTGGSRLWIAQKHKLDVPCVINDFANIFPDAEVLDTVESVKNKFKDDPIRVSLNSHGVSVFKIPQVHLDGSNS